MKTVACFGFMSSAASVLHIGMNVLCYLDLLLKRRLASAVLTKDVIEANHTSYGPFILLATFDKTVNVKGNISAKVPRAYEIAMSTLRASVSFRFPPGSFLIVAVTNTR